MRRYHPDKHQNQNAEFIAEINEICRVTNKIYEAIAS
jgi:hypothetical protein